MSELYDKPQIDETEKADNSLETKSETVAKQKETSESAETAQLKETYGDTLETKENDDGTIAEETGFTEYEPKDGIEESSDNSNDASDYQWAMRPNQTPEELASSVDSLNEQFFESESRLDITSDEIEPGAELTHEEFYQEQNKLDMQAEGFSEEFVNNSDVFNPDTKEISYPDEGGYKLDEDGNAIFDTYDSVKDFKDSHTDDVTITRRGSHDGTYFAVGDTDYEESALAQKEEYFDDKTVEYNIDSLPPDCKIVCGEVAEWDEAGLKGGGEQIQFAKTNKDGEILYDDNGKMETYSVSELEHGEYIKRVKDDES
jgi:hypothetical protein